MADLALRWGRHGGAELFLEANDIATDAGLETAILISLFTDRRTDDPAAVPTGDGDLRGWWADSFPVVEGDLIGSRLWLLSREKRVESVPSRAEEYAREALDWLIEDRVADRVEVSAEWEGRDALILQVVVHQPEGPPAEYRYHYTWQAQAARRLHHGV